MRHNQGNAFTKAGYSNWKKQYSNIAKHEKSESHISAKIAQVVFLLGRSINSCLEQQEKTEILRRKREVLANETRCRHCCTFTKAGTCFQRASRVANR